MIDQMAGLAYDVRDALRRARRVIRDFVERAGKHHRVLHPRVWVAWLAWDTLGLVWWRFIVWPVKCELGNLLHWLGRGHPDWVHWTPLVGDRAYPCTGQGGTVVAVSIRQDKVTFVDGSTHSLRDCVHPTPRARGDR